MTRRRTMRRRRGFRRGSAYVAVLGASMIVMVIGLSALTATRIQHRNANWVNDIVEARSAAQTGMAWALYKISNDDDWRTTRPNGQWADKKSIDGGEFSVWVTDPGDGDLSDSVFDPVIVKVGGYKGDARQMIQVQLNAELLPLEALGYCLFTTDDLQVNGGKTLTVTDAPLHVVGDLRNDGTIIGSVEAGSVSWTGVITGGLIAPAEAKHAPDPGIFDLYKSMATTIPKQGTMDKVVLSPGSNPYGAGVNANGVYFMDTGGADLIIKLSRIHGTLVVDCSGGRVTIETKSLLHSFRADFPVLIVDGDVEIKLRSDTQAFIESVENVNLNPPGSPYEGVSDADQVDTYPSEVRGLVHVKGELKIKETSKIVGVVICEGNVIVDGELTIVHDPAWVDAPPAGYTYVERMLPALGSWQQVMP